MRASGGVLVDLGSAVRADLGILHRRLFLLCKLIVQRIHSLHKQEDHKGHDDEVDDGSEEGSVIEGGGTGFFCLRQRVMVVAVQMSGMMISSTREETIFWKAPPIMTPTAMSMTLPLIRKA